MTHDDGLSMGKLAPKNCPHHCFCEELDLEKPHVACCNCGIKRLKTDGPVGNPSTNTWNTGIQQPYPPGTLPGSIWIGSGTNTGNSYSTSNSTSTIKLGTSSINENTT